MTNPIPGITISTEDVLTEWRCELTGPQRSAYSGGTFKIKITFPLEYPFKPPIIKFLTKIYHPNIDDEGAICLSLLKNEVWKPATQMRNIVTAILQLLIEPNPDDPLDSNIANIYRNDRKTFETNVTTWINKYAI